MKHLTILFLLSSIIWLGCSDNDSVSTNESVRMKNLTSGEWIRVKMERNGLDMWSIFPECAKDDPIGYSSDGMAYIDQGILVCDSTYPQRTTWKWTFIDNETKIKETINDSTEYIRIIRVLNDTHFEYVSYNQTDSIVSYFEKF